MNNGINQDVEQEISDFCKQYNILEIKISQDNCQPYCSYDHIIALDYIYRRYIAYDNADIRVVMDSDIIAYSNFSFTNIIKDYEIAGFKVYNYSSAIFTMYSKSVNLNGFNINTRGDSGSGTGILILQYNTRWINLTAPVREEEARYIFHYESDDVLRYDASFGFQFIEDCFIHFYRGTGWDNGNIDYFHSKFKFLMQLINHPELYNIKLDEIVLYPEAFNDQWLYKENYPLYKLLNYELSNIHY